MEQFFDRIWEMSLFAIPIILLLAAFSGRLGRRYGAHWRYLLWVVLTIRLCLPVQPTLPEQWTGIRMQMPSVRTEMQTLLQERTEAPIGQIEAAEPIALPAPTQMQTAAPGGTVNFDPNSSYQNPIDFFLAYPEQLWALGAVLFLLWQGWKYIAFARYLRRNRQRISDAAVLDIYYGLCRQMHLKKRPKLYFCDGLPSPLCIGFFKPAIYLHAQEQEEVALRLIFKHELIHCRRGDLWYKGVLMLARALHFFNPFVHWMAALAERDMEFSCDLAVIKDCDLQERERYSMTILEMIRQTNRKSMQLSTAFSGGKEGLKARIENIFDTSAKKRGVAAFLAVALLIGGGSAFLGCGRVQESTSPQVVYGAYTEDIVQQLYAAKLDYIGDASGVGKLLRLLPYPQGVAQSGEGMELFTEEGQPYGVRLYLQDFTQAADVGWFPIHGMIFLALVENADFLEYACRDGDEVLSMRFSRESAQDYFGERDLREFAQDEESFRQFVLAIHRFFYEQADAQEQDAQSRMNEMLLGATATETIAETEKSVLYRMIEASSLSYEIASRPLPSSAPQDYMDCPEYAELVAIGEPALMEFLCNFAQGYVADDLEGYIKLYACQDILGEARTDAAPTGWYRTYTALDSLSMAPFCIDAGVYTSELQKQYSMGSADQWSIAAASTDDRLQAVYTAMQGRYGQDESAHVLHIYAPDIHKIVEKGEKMQVYLTAMESSYAFIRTKKGYAFVERGGSVIPSCMDFVKENGTWRLSAWIEAEDGSRYADSIRQMCGGHPLVARKMLQNGDAARRLQWQNLIYYMKAHYDSMEIPVYISSHTEEGDLQRLNRDIPVVLIS